jgi:hypothetical protein
MLLACGLDMHDGHVAVTCMIGQDHSCTPTSNTFACCALQEAGSLALRCLRGALAQGTDSDSAARIAAKVVARRAVSLGARDNVTALVVSLLG